MSWNSSTKILLKPFTKIAENGNGDLQRALGSTKMTQIRLFTETDIKIAAKYKPFRHTTAIFTTSGPASGDRLTARAGVNYGLTIPECTTAQLYGSSGAANWAYNLPNGTSYPFRALDFDGYYADPPVAPIFCVRHGILSANTINVNAKSPCAFYIYQKEGQLADKLVDPSSGISNTSAGRNSNQKDAICDMSDLTVSGSTIYNKTNPHLGLALYQGTSFRMFVPCFAQLVASQSQRNNRMFIMDISDFTDNNVPVGTYTAVASVRYQDGNLTYYMPLPQVPLATGDEYQNTFELRSGGANLYTYFQWGLATTNEVSDNGTIVMRPSGRFDDVYVTIHVRNDSGIEHQSDENNSSWILISTVTGTVNGEPFPSGGRVVRSSMENYYSGPGSSASEFVHIDNNGYVDITFKIENVWSPTGQSRAQIVDSGNLSITCQLVYNAGGVDDSFTRGPELQQHPLSLSYSATV